MCTHQKHLARQEEQSTYDKRKRDIDLYGYEKAFKKDSGIMSYEKAKWMKKEGRLENV